MRINFYYSWLGEFTFAAALLFTAEEIEIKFTSDTVLWRYYYYSA